MEVALGVIKLNNYGNLQRSLNPYFSGSCSWSRPKNFCFRSIKRNRLNPYFSGSCSWRRSNDLFSKLHNVVLILILVEVALGAIRVDNKGFILNRLNPYFSGSCSWRQGKKSVSYKIAVLS